ncbi:MAG: phosphate propanoyltransferase [Candidatus Nealsonbacteria bacterium]
MLIKTLIEISARHIHLSQTDLAVLFGKNYCLTQKKALTQPGEFAAQETVTVRFKDKEISSVRIIGPVRQQTQLEISLTDAYNLGITPVIRLSGDIKDTLGMLLAGPKGKVTLKEGAIIAWRHLHISSKEAEKLGMTEKTTVSVKTEGARSLTFHNIKVRIKEDYQLSVHLDTDEGNAADIKGQTFGELII